MSRLYVPPGITLDEFIDELIARGHYSCKCEPKQWGKPGSRMCVVSSSSTAHAIITVSRTELLIPNVGTTGKKIKRRTVVYWEPDGLIDLRPGSLPYDRAMGYRSLHPAVCGEGDDE